METRFRCDVRLRDYPAAEPGFDDLLVNPNGAEYDQIHEGFFDTDTIPYDMLFDHWFPFEVFASVVDRGRSVIGKLHHSSPGACR